MVIFNFNEDTTDSTIKRRLKREGYSEKRIDSFMKGWLQVKNYKEKK